MAALKRKSLIVGKVYRIEDGVNFELYSDNETTVMLGQNILIGDTFLLLGAKPFQQRNDDVDPTLTILHVIGVESQFCGWTRSDDDDLFTEVKDE